MDEDKSPKPTSETPENQKPSTTENQTPATTDTQNLRKSDISRPSDVSEFNLQADFRRMSEMQLIYNVDDDVTIIANDLTSSVAHLESVKITTKRQWISGIIANTTLFSFGMQNGWLSPNLAALKNPEGPIRRVATSLEISWIAGTFSLLAMISSTMYGVFSDKFGRKTSLFVIVVPQLMFWILKFLTADINMLLISQALGGMSGGGVFAVCLVYTKEISSNSTRGSMLSIAVLLQGLGTLSMFLLGQNIGFYTCSAILALIPVGNFFGLFWVPESPPYLVSKGELEKAINTIAFLNGIEIDHPHVNIEIMRLMNEQEARKSMAEIVNFSKLIKTKSVKKALLIAFTIETVVELGGCFVIVTYSAWIVGEENEHRANLLSLVTPIALIFGTLVSFFTVERAGRRILLLTSVLAAVFSTLLLAIPLQLKQYGYKISTVFPVAGIILCTFFYGGGIYAVGYIVMPEVLSFQLRSKVMSVVLSYGWLLCFLQVLFFPNVSDTIGMFTVFYFFCFINVIGGIILYKNLPETKDKTQAEIDELLMTQRPRNRRYIEGRSPY